MTRPRNVVAPLVLVVVSGCSGVSANPEDIRADWCDRADLWATEFIDQTSRYEQDPSAVTDEDVSRLADLHAQMLADPVPDELDPVIGTLRGELPDEEAAATSDALDAGEQLATSLEEGCGMELSEPTPD